MSLLLLLASSGLTGLVLDRTGADTVAEPTEVAEGVYIHVRTASDSTGGSDAAVGTFTFRIRESHAVEYLYENAGFETTIRSPGVQYIHENVGYEVILTPHGVQYVYQNQLVTGIISATTEDSLPSIGDAAEASIIWAGRTGEDGVPEPGDSEAHTTYLVRTGSDVAGGEDTVYAARTTYITTTDIVPVPTDVAIGIVTHIFYRTGTEFLDRPVDAVETFTYISDFRPSFEAPGRRLVRVRAEQVTIGPMATNWSSDVSVSKPRAYSAARPVLVDFGGFGFTTGGIAHNITEAQVEEQFMPVFSPEEVSDGA